MTKIPTAAFWRQIICLVPVYLNVLVMGSGLGWLPNAMYLLTKGQEVRATSTQCAWIASCSIFGRLVFAIPAGILADKYGRKEITICVAFLHFSAWLGLSMSSSIVTIYIGRFVIGLAEVLINSTALISIGEIASAENRGRLTTLYHICASFGGILSSLISLSFSSYSTLSRGIAALSFISLLSMFWASETPSFLVSSSKLNEAKNNLRYIRRGYKEQVINNEFEKIKNYIQDEKARKKTLSWIKFLKLKSIRKPLLVGILANFFSKSTGVMLMRNYITLLIPSNKFVARRYYPLVIQTLLLLVSTNATLYIDKIPRRTLILVGSLILAGINGVCGLSSYLMAGIQNEDDVFRWVFIVTNILAILCYTISVQPVTTVLKSELYPQSVKGFCVSLGSLSQSLSTVLSYQMYHFTENLSILYVMYIVFSINSVLLYLIMHFFMPEGLGTSLTDLQMTFKEPTLQDGHSVEKNSQT
ncbi:glucose transporter GlcP-like [Planococcus citri]|uniref:glucose transporter GlcP-like n=1 Tax=Planococcus citri TaxID=170843 RepID=UPI0031FA1CF5